MRGAFKRAFALAGLAGLTLSAGLLGSPSMARAELPAGPPAAKTVSHTTGLSSAVTKLMKGSGVEAEAKALDVYWTSARMKAAKPMDATSSVMRPGKATRRNAQTSPDGPAGSVAPLEVKAPAADKSAKTPQASFPNYPAANPTARTNGKVFFSRGEANYVCSASIVASEGRSLVWTAGHCLAENAVWSSNVAFVPAYSAGSEPYGTWYAKNLTTTAEWFYNHEWDYDVGAMTMTPTAGVRIADYLGAQGIMWNQTAGYTSNAFAYPAGSPYDGEYLVRADGDTADEGDNTIYMYSGLTGGSSGGPWFRNFNETSGLGFVNGHNDFIYTNSPAWMYSPYYGGQVSSLYNAVRYQEVYKLTTATPKISGSAKVGKVLTAVPGTWKPSPVTLAYQWKINGKVLSGATASTLTVPAAAKGKKITVTVTGSKVGYSTASKTSASTAKVKVGSLSAATPTVTGTAVVGQVLTANAGSWAPAPVALSYQWYRNSSKIKRATGATYTLVKADKGKKIKVKVTGKKSGFTTLSKVSKKTATVTAA